MGREHVMVINPGLEERVSSTGRKRFTVRIDAEPVYINNDPKTLGQPVADAIARHFREAIKGIASQAAPATLKAREVAAKAYKEGKSWALKRYGGGRIGSMEPGQSARLFNDSGRMATSIVANASSDGAWRINVAGNRFDPKTIGEAGVLRIWTRLVQLIPEFGNAALLLENAILRRTIEEVARERIKKGKLTSKQPTSFGVFAATFLRAS